MIKPTDKGKIDLNDVGELYRVYSSTNNKPPTSPADFKALANVAPGGYTAVTSGRVLVNFGATMTDLTDGPAKPTSDQVLAYEKQVPESGGAVLMLDRTVRTMTADEFKAAKKAGK